MKYEALEKAFKICQYKVMEKNALNLVTFKFFY
jgi:hypothetical protein